MNLKIWIFLDKQRPGYLYEYAIQEKLFNYPDKAAHYQDFNIPETSKKGGFLVKADSNHVLNLDESFYNVDQSFTPNIAIDEDNNLYMAFSFGGTLTFNSVLLEQNPNEYKIVIMKFDSGRNLVWMNQIKPVDPQNYTLLFNSEGKKISELNPSISTYDTSHISSGVYYIIAVFKDGVEVKKIFKR